MAYRQTRERVKIKTEEDKSGMVSSLFIHPVSLAVRDKDRDHTYSWPECLSEMARFKSLLFLTGVSLPKGILL
jgi:hypothetical protein